MHHGDQRSRRLWQAEDGSGIAHVPEHERDTVSERSHQRGEIKTLQKAILFGI
jgi:hypothetical protein